MYCIASVSWGKDSLAMLMLMIEKGYLLDEVVFYDTGVEFKAIYDTRDRVKAILDVMNIKYTELKPRESFFYMMFDKPVKERSGGTHKGYSWCGGRCRWGTTEKLKALDRYAESKNATVYIGIAADEPKRLAKERKAYKVFPLAEWGMTEKECLDYCYGKGFNWLEGDVKLYDILDRVSCWCCANKNLKELKNIYIHLPHYWQRLINLQSRMSRPMKQSGSVFELEERFAKEISGVGKDV